MFLKIIQMKNILLENKKLSETFESSQFHDEYIWIWISLDFFGEQKITKHRREHTNNELETGIKN